MLRMMIDEYGARVFKGMTKVANRPARWMSRMITRSYNPDDMRDVLPLYPGVDNLTVDCDEWVNDLKNVMLKEGDSVGLFKYEYPGVYCGHYFFRVRGKETLDLATRMLGEMFNKLGAEAIRGLVKTDHKPALVVTRRLGFKSYGVVADRNGEQELFIMTKKEYNDGRC